MALEVSYFAGSGETRLTSKVYGTLLGSASVTLTGTSASCGTVPAKTVLARLVAGEACYVSNNGTTASATNGINIPAGGVVDVTISEGSALLARTV